METRSSLRNSVARGVVAVSGLIYLLSGLALIVAPGWFFEHIGEFPPFNRHYMGDLGSFLAPLGGALIFAGRDPRKYRVLILAAALGSLLHGLNHIYDAVTEGAHQMHWLSDALPLTVFGVALGILYIMLPTSEN